MDEVEEERKERKERKAKEKERQRKVEATWSPKLVMLAVSDSKFGVLSLRFWGWLQMQAISCGLTEEILRAVEMNVPESARMNI